MAFHLARATNQINGVQHQLSFTVFLGNLPVWVTADDIQTWLSAEDLVADSIKVIRNHETQESKGFAFVEAPTSDEMQAIIRRFDRAPLEDRLLRANPAQPTKPKGATDRPPVSGSRPPYGGPPRQAQQPTGNPGGFAAGATTSPAADQRPPRRGKKSAGGQRR